MVESFIVADTARALSKTLVFPKVVHNGEPTVHDLHCSALICPSHVFAIAFNCIPVDEVHGGCIPSVASHAVIS